MNEKDPVGAVGMGHTAPNGETVLGVEPFAPVTEPVSDVATPPPSVEGPLPPAKPRSDWMGSILLLAAIGVVLWSAIAAYGAGWNAWSRDAGIAQLYMAGAAALVIGVLAVLLFIAARKRGWRQSVFKRLITIFISFGLVSYLGSWWAASMTSPALHDISTSLADPPVFRTVLLRDDNWDSIPEADNADYQGLSPRQRWEQIHRESYPDVRTVRVDQSATLLMQKAERLANARGWDIVDFEEGEGRLEARTTSTLMAYPHSIAVRIRPAEGGNGAIVDMRSVSGEGQNDLGSNAEIIRAFLSDLSGTTSGA